MKMVSAVFSSSRGPISIHIFCSRGAHFCKNFLIELNPTSLKSLMGMDRVIDSCPL